MTTLAFAPAINDAPVATVTRRGITAIQLHEALWRITRNAGEVMGYIEKVDDNGTARYRAKRLMVLRQRFLPIGEFWSMEDALDSLRF